MDITAIEQALERIRLYIKRTALEYSLLRKLRNNKIPILIPRGSAASEIY